MVAKHSVISKEILATLAGFIEVISEPNIGATFDIYLPASSKVAVIEQDLASDEVLKGKATILVVDDEKIVLDVGDKMLQNLGYKVITADSGKKALGIFKKNKEEIDLVILDLIMPGLSGKETFRRLKKLKPELNILIASGYSFDSDTEKLLPGDTHSDFIQKPFNLGSLSQRLYEMLDEK